MWGEDFWVDLAAGAVTKGPRGPEEFLLGPFPTWAEARNALWRALIPDPDGPAR